MERKFRRCLRLVMRHSRLSDLVMLRGLDWKPVLRGAMSLAPELSAGDFACGLVWVAEMHLRSGMRFTPVSLTSAVALVTRYGNPAGYSVPSVRRRADALLEETRRACAAKVAQRAETQVAA